MTSLLNFLAFQAAWFAAVEGGARGRPWLGPLAVLALCALHLALVRRRLRELAYLALVGVLGTLADTGLHALGATAYPTAPAHALLVPPWITALWVAFATLPRFSLAWLAPRPALAAALGAFGGPLSYLAGARLGAVEAAGSLTWSCLAAEYALVTPLLLRLHATLVGPEDLSPRARAGTA